MQKQQYAAVAGKVTSRAIASNIGTLPNSTFKPQDLLNLAQAATHYAQAVANATQCKDTLYAGHHDWHVKSQTFMYIPRSTNAWNAVMLATTGEYRELRKAKSREWRVKQKLLALAKRWEGE